MKVRYTLLGDTTVEVVVDGDSLEVNVLPADSSPPADSQTVNTPPAGITPPQWLMVSAPVTPKKHRGLSAFIRGAWTLIFGVAGEAAVYVLDNLGILNLPPGAGVALGAVLYSIKKYVRPDGLL